MLLHTDMKFHLTSVDRSRDLWEALREVGTSFTVPRGVASLPPLKGGVDIHFFTWRGKAGATFSDPFGRASFTALSEEYARRGLQPADIHTVCAANKEDPSLMERYPHLTIMKDVDGQWVSMGLYLYDHRLPHRKVERVINFRREECLNIRNRYGESIDTLRTWFVGIPL